MFNVQDVFCQNISNSTITATITSPIGITKTADINIRSSAVSTSSGNITIDPDKTNEIRNSINLPFSKDDVIPASFNVTGEESFIYSITLPTSVFTAQSTLDSSTVLINNFTSLPTGTGVLTSGTQTVFVGASVNFKASQQVIDKNDSEDFEIIINYN